MEITFQRTKRKHKYKVNFGTDEYHAQSSNENRRGKKKKKEKTEGALQGSFLGEYNIQTKI